MQPDLPTDYYLSNVVTLFTHVETLYGDILPCAHLDFLQRFALLGSDAQKLYVRLLNRSHLLFRLSKLRYPEIDNIDDALQELESQALLCTNPDIEHEQLLTLFNKTELIAFHPQQSSLRKSKRSEIDAFLLTQADDEFFSRLKQSDTLIEVLQKDSYLLCQMLFFGNMNQSMTDFVLRDLGLNQYESYRIDPQTRPYTSALEIKQHWLLHQIDVLLQLTEPTDIDTLNQCFAAVPDDLHNDTAGFRKAERIRYRIARQLERLGRLSLALDCYQHCALPPSRERIARILLQQGDAAPAIDVCKTMIAQPYNEEEAQIANALGKRISQRHQCGDDSVFKPLDNTHKPPLIELELMHHSGVEQAVVEHYLSESTHQRCYHLENTLFNGVLGLLIWDAMFAPVSGAFYNPFQSRPNDFYAHDFIAKRQSWFTRIWSTVNNNDDIHRLAQICWNQKYGVMNTLVNWQRLDWETIELALQRIEYTHWDAIFQRILRDLRNNRSGFPDLVLFPASEGYCLIEVKGPGDTLQKNQQRWMQYFAEHDIPHALARVRWASA